MSTIKNSLKTYVFIDFSNLIYGAKRTGGWKINYEKLYLYLKTRFFANKIFFYTGVESFNKNPYIGLEKLGYILKLKIIKKFNRSPITKQIICPNCNSRYPYKFNRYPEIKANCDVDLTFDAMRFILDYNCVILMSGDGDFYPLINYLMAKKKVIKVIGESTSTAIAIK